MLFYLFIFCALLPLIPSLPIVPVRPQRSDVQSSLTAKAWTDQSLCVLKMGSSCPIGFIESQIKLSVKPDVMPADKGEDNQPLIEMGTAGESSLTRNSYDAVYTLKLIMCCKK